jgi:hypothetical protein
MVSLHCCYYVGESHIFVHVQLGDDWSQELPPLLKWNVAVGNIMGWNIHGAEEQARLKSGWSSQRGARLGVQSSKSR